MIERNRFLNKLNLYYSAGFYYSVSENNGLDGSRTTGGSFSYVYSLLTIKKPIFLQQVLWDVANASTYTLTIAGVSYGDQTTTGAKTDVTWEIKKLYPPTNSIEFRLTRATSGTIRDANITSYSGTYFNIPSNSYYGGTSYGYAACIRLVYKPVIIELF